MNASTPTTFPRRRFPRRNLGHTALLALTVGATALAAQDAAPMEQDAAPVSVEQLLESVLEANLRVESARLDAAAADATARAEWWIFEPEIVAGATAEANKRQNTRERFLSQGTSVFDEDNTIHSVGVETLLPTGGRLRVGGQTRRLDNNLQVTGRDESESFASVSLTQPLLRGAGWGATVAQARLAAAQSDVARQEMRRQLMLVLSQAELAYWDLVAASEVRALRERSAATAETVLRDNRLRVETGKMSAIEVLQAEAGVAVRRASLAEAAQQRVDALSRLAAFLGVGGDAPLPEMRTSSALETDYVPGSDAAALLADTFALHPAYLAQEARVRQDNIRVAYARNQRWPQLDLRASYGLNGLGNTYRESWERVNDQDFRSWYVGVELRIPILGNQRGRNQSHVAEIRARQGLLELKAIEVDLSNAVLSLVRRVESLRAKEAGFTAVAELQQRILESELSRLDAGQSDSRRVLQAEEDLAQAVADRIAARVELRRAVVDLWLQSGAYLRERRLEAAE